MRRRYDLFFGILFSRAKLPEDGEIQKYVLILRIAYAVVLFFIVSFFIG